MKMDSELNLPDLVPVEAWIDNITVCNNTDNIYNNSY